MPMPKPKLAAGIVTYSDAKGLDRLLSTLADNVDLSIIIHGPFPNFKQDPNSTKETAEVCSNYRNANANIRFIDIPFAWPEIARRQGYLDCSDGYDFCLVIDSDEYISEDADWSLFRQNLERLIKYHPHSRWYLYDIMFKGPPHHAWPRPRLFYKPSQIIYDKLHVQWILPNGKTIRNESDSRQIIDGITIEYDNEKRSDSRIEARDQYREWFGKYELQFV
jgi:hypothetical protein